MRIKISHYMEKMRCNHHSNHRKIITETWPLRLVCRNTVLRMWHVFILWNVDLVFVSWKCESLNEVCVLFWKCRSCLEIRVLIWKCEFHLHIRILISEREFCLLTPILRVVFWFIIFLINRTHSKVFKISLIF